MRLIAEFSGDLRFAVRTLRRHKAFATMAVVTLALGLGANIAAFSAFDAVLMRRLPVERPEELVTFDWLRTAFTLSRAITLPCKAFVNRDRIFFCSDFFCSAEVLAPAMATIGTQAKADMEVEVA